MIQSVQMIRCIGKIFGGFQNATSILTKRGYHPGVLKRHCYAGSDYPFDYEDDSFPHLTQLKCYGRPADIAHIFNHLLLSDKIVKPMLDETFSYEEFLYNSRKMVEKVSSRIAKGDFEGLEGLVTPNVIAEIKTNLPTFTTEQRRDLAVNDEELVYSFLNMFDIKETVCTSKCFGTKDREISLEILTIHHAHKGIEKIKRLAGHIRYFNEETKMELTRVYILNYRFERKFHPDTNALDDWIINGVQHLSGYK